MKTNSEFTNDELVKHKSQITSKNGWESDDFF